MFRTFLQKLDQAKKYIKTSLARKKLFTAGQQRTFTDQQITRAVRFALASNATDYKHFMDVENQLAAIVFYLLRGERVEAADQLLTLQEEAFWMIPKYVLHMWQKYLQRVMPTNITYYHFIREKQFYTQFVALRSVLVLGLHHSPHIFAKMKTSQKIYLFEMLLEWLLALVNYRCSAIYIISPCVDPLIYQAHLLLCVLLGEGGHSILSSLTEGEVCQVINKMLYIEGFLLSMAIPNNDYLSIQVVLVCLRKLLTSAPKQKILMYLPSYLYADLIGFIKAPFTTEVIARLLIHFLQRGRGLEGRDSSQVIEVQDFDRMHLVTECWSALALLSDEYQISKSEISDLILNSLPTLENRSMVRAFVLRIASCLHLDLQEGKIADYMRTHQQPYVVNNKVISPGLFAKNYHLAMEHEHYLGVLKQAAKRQWQRVDRNRLWQLMTQFNRYKIMSLDHYLRQLETFDTQ